jgi:hypothetical protein
MIGGGYRDGRGERKEVRKMYSRKWKVIERL